MLFYRQIAQKIEKQHDPDHMRDIDRIPSSLRQGKPDNKRQYDGQAKNQNQFSSQL